MLQENLSIINSLYTQDRMSSPTMHNTSVLRTEYAVCALKNLPQIGYTVSTKRMVIVQRQSLF